MRRRGLTALLACAAVALWASSASAAATRAEYAAAVNPICAASNAEIDRIYNEAFAKLKKLEKKSKKKAGGGSITAVTSKKRKPSNPLDAFNRIFHQAYERVEAIQRAELAQLGLVAPAPGDESLVSAWLANRLLLVDLGEIARELEEKESKLFDKTFLPTGKHPTLKSFKRSQRRLQRRIKRFNRQLGRIAQQILATQKVDLEYGTQLGVTYCVTGASGAFARTTVSAPAPLGSPHA